MLVLLYSLHVFADPGSYVIIEPQDFNDFERFVFQHLRISNLILNYFVFCLLIFILLFIILFFLKVSYRTTPLDSRIFKPTHLSKIVAGDKVDLGDFEGKYFLTEITDDPRQEGKKIILVRIIFLIIFFPFFCFIVIIIVIIITIIIIVVLISYLLARSFSISGKPSFQGGLKWRQRPRQGTSKL